MAEFQEDQLGMLDIGKSVAAAAFNPFVAYGYDPNAWKIRQGGISLDPFTKNPLAYVGRGIRNAMIKRKFKGRSPAYIKKAILNVKEANKKSITSTFDKLGFKLEDNILRMSKTPMHERTWYKKSIARSDVLKYRRNNFDDLFGSRKTQLVDNANRLKDLNKQLSGYKKSPGKKSKGYKILQERDALQATQNSLKGEIRNLVGLSRRTKDGWKHGALKTAQYGESMSRVGRSVGLRTLGGVVRLGVAAMKGFAVYNVASLMYEGINMIANPIGKAAVSAVNNTFNSLASFAKPELGGSLNMGFVSYGAATERQRAVQAISKSRINGRSMMGQEAQYMHN